MDVHVRDISPAMTVDEWLAELTFEDESYLHIQHGGESQFVSMRETPRPS